MESENNIGSILDQEIHYLTSVYNHLIKFKIRFIWCGNGYKVCAADNRNFVLTLDRRSQTVSMQNKYDLKNQIWNIEPHKTSRSFSLKNDQYFLCIKNGSFQISDRHSRYSHLTLSPVCGWIRFGALMMQYLGIIHVTDHDVTRAIDNYNRNIKINFSDNNKLRYNGNTIIIFQSGGSFSKLRFAESSMNNTSCEIMAVCNAIRLLTGKSSYKNYDFFRLSAEFEISGLKHSAVKKAIVTGGKKIGIRLLDRVPTNDGCWGGDPVSIRKCLSAYNIQFTVFHNLTHLDNNLLDGKCAVISYSFDILHQAIHTFSGIRSEGRFQAFNRFSDHSAELNYLNTEVPFEKREIFKNPSDSVLRYNCNNRFIVGYLLDSIKQ